MKCTKSNQFWHAFFVKHFFCKHNIQNMFSFRSQIARPVDLGMASSDVDAVLLPNVISCATFGPGSFLPPPQSEANGIQCEKYIFPRKPQRGRGNILLNQRKKTYFLNLVIVLMLYRDKDGR